VSAGDFSGLVAVVTGGGSGIGLATVDALRRAGARVAVLDLSPEAVTAAASDGLPEVFGWRTDVTDRGSVDAAMDAVAERFGGIDILVNSAGVSCVGTVEESTEADWERVLDINVRGTARACAAALPHLRRSAHAAIVTVCSIGALNGLPQRAVYNASKGAVLSLTYAMATDHVADGVRVNCVSPGTVATPFVERMLQQFPDPAAERAALDARQATGRMVTPDEVAGAILYLASPRAGSTTGTALEVDGGVTHLRIRPPR